MYLWRSLIHLKRQILPACQLFCLLIKLFIGQFVQHIKAFTTYSWYVPMSYDFIITGCHISQQAAWTAHKIIFSVYKTLFCILYYHIKLQIRWLMFVYVVVHFYHNPCLKCLWKCSTKRHKYVMLIVWFPHCQTRTVVLYHTQNSNQPVHYFTGHKEGFSTLTNIFCWHRIDLSGPARWN